MKTKLLIFFTILGGIVNGQCVMVKDIFPGADSSMASSIINVGSTAYFLANDGINGKELWKSDGTVSGTVMVKDINPGSGSSGTTALMKDSKFAYPSSCNMVAS
jgi:ELWxxDGT repeat protein